jgi:hypothetical protein
MWSTTQHPNKTQTTQTENANNKLIHDIFCLLYLSFFKQLNQTVALEKISGSCVGNIFSTATTSYQSFSAKRPQKFPKAPQQTNTTTFHSSPQQDFFDNLRDFFGEHPSGERTNPFVLSQYTKEESLT